MMINIKGKAIYFENGEWREISNIDVISKERQEALEEVVGICSKRLDDRDYGDARVKIGTAMDGHEAYAYRLAAGYIAFGINGGPGAPSIGGCVLRGVHSIEDSDVRGSDLAEFNAIVIDQDDINAARKTINEYRDSGGISIDELKNKLG